MTSPEQLLSAVSAENCEMILTLILNPTNTLGSRKLKPLVRRSRVVELVAPLVHLAIVFVEERDAFTLTSTVILGCAGIAGFSEAFGLASSELDLSP